MKTIKAQQKRGNSAKISSNVKTTSANKNKQSPCRIGF